VTDSNRVIFIVGNSRSGTTMLGRIFGSHSQVHTFGELHFFEQIVSEKIVKLGECWPSDRLLTMLERLITSAREGLFCPVTVGKYRSDAEKILNLTSKRDPVSVYECFLREETRRHRKHIPCEQTPRYLFSAIDILNSFPDARMINLVRDPRDVLLSQKNKWRRRFLGAKNIPLSEAFRSWVNYHPYTIARLWVSSVRMAQELEGHDRFMSLHFENLLKDPEQNIKNLCDFTGLTYEVEMLSVPQVGSSSGMDHPGRLGIDNTKASGWKKGGISKTELAICQSVASQEMRRLGYEFEPVSVPLWRRWLSMVTFFLKISIALLLNLRRSKNIVRSIRRRLIKPKK